ncbi:Cupin domain-containing protein [Murinocardiopsis flavida]|uniref:Cupin domain-containing protein n=1 Tax=Murinocardiopsis flavida TaxID=645275 RepID=A0A2P8D3P1_9ACTN|nr:cupin domain-containing protein [Murinocardiopsis flavida]PSK91827.1 Cupin domain-containing protein [Murinocardiopsis flavida]
MSAIDPATVPTQLFDWGRITWRVSPDNVPGTGITVGDVVIFPGKGHDHHTHPGSDEVLYVVAGRGEQTVGDGPAFPVAAGDMVHVPRGVLHSTHNTGWSVLHLVAIYNPAGAEQALRDAPGFREIGPGEQATLANA